MAQSGASLLLTDCPECWHTYALSGLGISAGATRGRYGYIFLTVQERLKPGRLEEISTVTYHDPCIWARVAEKCAAPRELLQQIPGLVLHEARPARRETRCCGGGAMFQLTFPERSAAIARQRLGELPPSDVLVTSCPFCRENLQVGGGKVLDLVELLGRAML